MDAADKRMLEREALRNMIQQWNANRLDLFALSEPNENLEFHGVMRFYFQDSGQKIATKCIRVASDATVSDVIEILIEKFRPDMRMLSLGSYSLWETHGPDDERKLEPHEKPLLVQLNWHADDREGRFLLKCLTNNEVPLSNDKGDQNFKRKLSKREKKELKKKEKLSRLKSDVNDENRPVAEKLYTELPETSFMRSISNPEAVMRRRRQQKLGRKLQQFKSKDGGPDTGGTLRIYGGILRPDVSYITLLLSVNDTAATVLRETLDKYGMSYQDPQQYCIVQEDKSDNSEYILEDDECPLALMNMTRSSIMFHVRRRPADTQPRRRKKKVGTSSTGGRPGSEPMLVEVAPDTTTLENGRRVRINDVVEIGSGNGTALQLYGPSIQPRHCVVAPAESGGYTVTPLHADAQVYLNGQRVMHTQRLQHGCLLKFGRVSTFRFIDPTQENLINRNLAQSQHFGSGSIYDRSPNSPGENNGAMSPTSLGSHQPDALDNNANSTTHDADYMRTMSPVSHDTYYRDGNDTITPYNNNTLKLDNESLMMSQQLSDSKDDYAKDEHSVSTYNDRDQSVNTNRTMNLQYKDNYETTFDLDGNVETKSICSAKSGGSGHDNRMAGSVGSAVRPGQEAILPAVLEFPEAGQAQFLNAVITRLDPHAPAFKLAPVYTLYLCARYRASTHYRPELTPTERAHKLTAFLHHVATLIHATVQERCTDSAAQAFWMANASELLHFLKYDRHISSFSTQAQELLPTTVQNAFSNLVTCFQEELSRALVTLTSVSGGMEATDATAPTLQALAAAMVLLRRCRVNAALTIQLFSHLFHYINAVCFNKLVRESGCISASWGAALSARLALLAAWAERQGLELAADCHLARTHQAARLIQGEYRTTEEVRAALGACFKLNSVQVRALLSPIASPEIVEAAVQHARALADELCRADGREVVLEESSWLGAGLLIPGDGFSAEVVRGVPPGLAEFVAPLQRGGLCRLAHQPHAIGLWTVYMCAQTQNRRAHDPRVHIIQLNKNSNGMGLSIVAAKGAGQSKLGIYIKSVVPGGAAAADGRLAAGDQLLSVDGQSLVGITQEKAAEYLVRTGPTVTLEVAKQGAMLHGLATLLHQPAYNQRQDEELQYEDRVRRNFGKFTNPHPMLLKPASPLTELATAGNGYGRRPCHNRCHVLRDESTESSTSDSEDYHPSPYYHGSIPRLIITLDRENNQLQEDYSPDTPGYPAELKSGPSRPIPVFTFTLEDFDEQHSNSDANTQDIETCEEPPKIPDPPANYEQSSESGEAAYLPPQMKPIDTKLTLDLFNARVKENDVYRRRCTGIDECVTACDCCRTPQPETQQIPYIDEPNSEPLIFEDDGKPKEVATPKIRRILPSLSLDKSDEKPKTADAVCQTNSSPPPVQTVAPPIPARRNLDLNLELKNKSKEIENIHCRLRRALFNMSKSISGRSEDTELPSTYSTSESLDDMANEVAMAKPIVQTPIDPGGKQILDSVDRKSWKSPDEFRPSFGKVKELTKHFNSINLRYCVKNYKRNCQSSPNLSTKVDKSIKISETIAISASLADIQYEANKTDTLSSRADKITDDEVKSILIQLEDWSKYGSRGSEDTLAHGNEFELPNLPSEELHEIATNEYVFNEIVEKKPKTITLDNIRLKSNQSSVNSEQVKISKDSLKNSSSLENDSELKVPRTESEIIRKCSLSLLDVSLTAKNESRRESYEVVVQSCPNIGSRSSRGRSACAAGNVHHSCPTLGTATSDSSTRWGGTGAVRRASERDLPSRLLAEPVKPSKSTPALHHAANAASASAASPKPHHPTPNATLSPGTANGSPTWPNKSRSSHNLSSATPHDGFYQNLSTVHSQQAMHLQDRWSSLRSSTGSNRPQSAHFSASTQQEQSPDSPLHHQQSQPNIMSARAAKLAEMSEEVTRRQQQKQPANIPHQHTPTHNHIMGQSPHMHQQQPQYQPQAGPQLANSHAHPTQQQQIYHNPHVQPQRYEWHPPGPPSPQRSQPPIAPKPQSQSARKPDTEFDERLHQQMQRQPQQQTQLPQSQLPQQAHLNQQSLLQQQQIHQQQQQNQMQHQQNQMHLQQQQNQMQHQQMQLQQQPQFQQSQLQQQQLHSPHQSQQHLHYQQQHTTSTVQPEDERYVASALEPPAVSVYPAGGSGSGGAKGAPPYNPWQREERERQAEVRRAIARARRDAAISQLLALGASRTPVQNQQLRALQLERDFELRATQHDQEEGGVLEVGDDEDRSSPEGSLEGDPRAPAPPQPTQTHPNPPKSILKSNTRTDVVEQYVHRQEEMVQEENTILTEMSSSMSVLSVGSNAPPPPQRGSSFAVMASRARALSPPNPPSTLQPMHTQQNANTNANMTVNANTNANAHPAPTVEHTPAPQSPVPGGRDKRVSFEERGPPAPPASSPPPLHDAPPREDPDKFIEEAENMLVGPASPTTPTSMMGSITHTPGVIGAQEVYRDPRARRLAEQQARLPSAPIPEQLSFKEKMKMFALESGEASTPKDKVKISRAQRDIDAVH